MKTHFKMTTKKCIDDKTMINFPPNSYFTRSPSFVGWYFSLSIHTDLVDPFVEFFYLN